jgi:hypothetical protein
MPETIVEISIQRIAKMTQSMNAQEIETLYLLLTQEGKELLKREQDLDSNSVTFLTRDEVFDVLKGSHESFN